MPARAPARQKSPCSPSTFGHTWASACGFTPQYADLQTYLPGDILAKVDRTSMAVSLEVRPPLLDPELVAWGLALPAAAKLRRGVGKRVLRDAASPLLPTSLLQRRKRGLWHAGEWPGVTGHGCQPRLGPNRGREPHHSRGELLAARSFPVAGAGHCRARAVAPIPSRQRCCPSPDARRSPRYRCS